MSSVAYLVLASAAGFGLVLLVVAGAARLMFGSPLVPLVYFGLVEERPEPLPTPAAQVPNTPPEGPVFVPRRSRVPVETLVEPSFEQRVRELNRKFDEIEQRYSLRVR